MQLAKPHRYDLLQALLGAVVFTVLGFSTAIFIQKLVDDVIEHNNPVLLHILGGFMILVLFIQTIVGIIRNIIGFRTGQVIDAKLITGYFRHLFNLPQQFFDAMRVGEIVSRVNDAVKIRLFINDTALGIMLNSLIVFFTVILLFFYYWKLALVVLFIFPVYWLLHFMTTSINRKWQRRIMEQSADLEASIVENLQAASTVKRLGLEATVIGKTEYRFFKLMDSAYKTGLYNLYTGTSADLLNRLLTIVVLWAGGWLVMQHEMSAGELLSFYSLIGYFTGPVAALITSGKNIQDALIAADRLFEITDLEAGNKPGETSVLLSAENLSDISFTGVSFRYGSRATVLDNLSVTFRIGQITAVVGESGSGKSTILHLLQNLYPVKVGMISIGKIPLQHFSNESLRKIVGVVPQQVDLFSGSIAENIAIGDDNPDMARIIYCCQQVGASAFIDQLPDGYWSEIGEKGTSLSGGQQQKLAIARALYRQPEVLILDEATAHLDPLSEDQIRNLLYQFKASGKTVIIIAHRLSTILSADTIHVLKRGKLEVSGNHKFLLQASDYYASLWPGLKGFVLDVNSNQG
jgi:ATP-binding cassette subfamily B protein